MNENVGLHDFVFIEDTVSQATSEYVWGTVVTLGNRYADIRLQGGLGYLIRPVSQLRLLRSLEEMRKCIQVWDQTIGCSNCGEAWWGDRSPDDITRFHVPSCALYGNEAVHKELDP